MQGLYLQSISNLYSRILEKGMFDDVVDAVFTMRLLVTDVCVLYMVTCIHLTFLFLTVQQWRV